MAAEHFSPCPTCDKLKWALIADPKLPGNDLLHCNECGFEVDIRVVKREQWILAAIDDAKDRVQE